MDIDTLLELSRMVDTVRITADAVVSSDPCYVFDVIIVSDGGGDADADLYNGESTGGRKKLDLYCIDEETRQYSFNPPMFLDRGCFVDIGSNCESVVVRLIHARP